MALEVCSGSKDPRLLLGVRKRRNYELEPLDVAVPKFKHDKYWVGPVPATEVTFANLNDNVSKEFLEEMCSKYGELVECRVYYHPLTRKHFGLAKALFETQQSAVDCCKALNGTVKMGNTMSVFLDKMGVERSRLVEQLCLSQMQATPMTMPMPMPMPMTMMRNTQLTLPQPPPPPPPPPSSSSSAPQGFYPIISVPIQSTATMFHVRFASSFLMFVQLFMLICFRFVFLSF